MKIAPNELRIGNYLSDGKGGHREVLSFHPDWYEHGYGVTLFRDAEPIPLTEEWLLAFGFEKVSSHFEIGEDIRRYALYINSTGNGFTCQLLRTFNGVHTITNFATDMLYVHQLQNLYFALTGKELTIKH